MAEHLITGYAGVGHVTSADAGLWNAGICGSGRYVLESTGQFPYTLVSANQIKIGAGDLVDQGRHINIPPNTEVTLSIDNGSQGKTRIDVVAMRYSKDAGTGVETAALVVLKGTEVAVGTTPTPAALTQGNIFTGATVDDTPLYQITITNLTASVTKVFKTLSPISGLLSKAYPVGAIYISVSNVNPANLFGFGTWEELQGRFLLGRSSGHAAGTTGGEENHTLTAAEIPAHTHTVSAHTHTVSAHTHTVSAHTHSGPSHTHTVSAHTHTIDSHNHIGSTESAGSHAHKLSRAKVSAVGTAKYAIQDASPAEYKWSEYAGAHVHPLVISPSGPLTAKSAGGGSTGSAGTGNTGSGGGGSTGSAGGGSTGSAGGGSTGSTGSGSAHNNMPPYLAVYMWKRTA